MFLDRTLNCYMQTIINSQYRSVQLQMSSSQRLTQWDRYLGQSRSNRLTELANGHNRYESVRNVLQKLRRRTATYKVITKICLNIDLFTSY